MKAAIKCLCKLLLDKLVLLLRWHDRSSSDQKLERKEDDVQKLDSCQQQDKAEKSLNCNELSQEDKLDQQQDDDQKAVMKSAISKIKTLVEDIDSKTDLLSFMDAKLTVLSMAKKKDEEDLGDSSSPLSCLSDSQQQNAGSRSPLLKPEKRRSGKKRKSSKSCSRKKLESKREKEETKDQQSLKS